MPFEANADHRYLIPRQRFKVTDWGDYDASLRPRGSLAVWVTEETIAAWTVGLRTTQGGQRTETALAILIVAEREGRM